MAAEKHHHPSVATDACVFTVVEDRLKVLLIRRGVSPHKGTWAVPGGFLKENETVEACVQRELVEETGLAGLDLKQFAVFSDPKRDSRGRVISIAYLAVIPNAERAQAGSDAAEAEGIYTNCQRSRLTTTRSSRQRLAG